MLPAEHDEIMHAVFALLGWGEETFRIMTLYNRDSQQGLDALNEEAEKKMTALSGKMNPDEKILLRRALEELGSGQSGLPKALISLLETIASFPEDKAHHIAPLLKNNSRMVSEAPPRLLFAFTTLGALLYLEHFA